MEVNKNDWGGGANGNFDKINGVPHRYYVPVSARNHGRQFSL